MVLREEPDGSLLAVAQPAHAALAGRLAAAWDDGLPAALLVAAGHHDDVWEAWDAAPCWSADTGRPRSFLELPAAERLAVWSPASEVAAPLGPEAELWVLRHAVRLHADSEEPGLRAMTERLRARGAALVTRLRVEDPARFDDLELARGTSLLALWDVLSLRLCFGVVRPRDAGVLHLSPGGDGAVGVAPWPFAGDRVETFVEARRLPGRLPGQPELDAAWAVASPFPLAVVLVPGA